MVRSIAAVLVGYLIFAVASAGLLTIGRQDLRTEPKVTFLVFGTLLGMFFATLSGYVAACLAGRAEFDHAFGVSFLIAVLGSAVLIKYMGEYPIWPRLTALLVMAPMAMVGGSFRRRQTHRPGAKTS